MERADGGNGRLGSYELEQFFLPLTLVTNCYVVGEFSITIGTNTQLLYTATNHKRKSNTPLGFSR